MVWLAASPSCLVGLVSLSISRLLPPQVVLLDDELRRQLLRAFTEDDRLHVEELARLFRMVQVRCLLCLRVQSVCAIKYCMRYVGCGRMCMVPVT